MERILREKLEYVFRNKIVVDWSKEPIPVIPSKSLAAIQAAANNSSIKANTDESDTTTLSSSQGGSPKCQRDGNKKRSGWDRRKSSTNNSSPSNPTPSATSRGGRRGASNAARGRGDKSATNARWAAPETTQHRLSQRADRFKDHLGAGSIAKSTSQLSLLASVDDTDLMSEQLEQFSIVGTMQELEKPYLRLTTAPDPANVRPPEVLEKALVHVKQRWKERGDYLWVCEQLKSIRQDLTVQRVQTEMTAEVYEAHAVIALEAGDSQEFHQCQSQLSLLHAEGFGSTRRLEFTAYRLLYYIFTQDYLGISTLLASLKSAQKANPYIRFALQVREAWALHNYKRFFHLVCSSDAVALLETEEGQLRGCRQVLAWSLDRERKKALKTILKACVISYGYLLLINQTLRHCSTHFCLSDNKCYVSFTEVGHLLALVGLGGCCYYSSILSRVVGM
uniref:SAC3_GANP domain-containing protein n=1 Tax=Mesocestoides corti TaxID=53468 RepID=A0A5K3ERC2_MESCO